MPADDTTLTAPAHLVEARNGVSYAYRCFGRPAAGVPPLTMLQHFRGLTVVAPDQRECELCDKPRTGTTPPSWPGTWLR